MKSISKKLARSVGDVVGIDWDKVDLEEFHKGMQVELEHGSKFGKKTNVTKDDLVATGKIALAHLLELPDYYTRLQKMEAEDKQLKEMIRDLVKEQLNESVSVAEDLADRILRSLEPSIQKALIRELPFMPEGEEPAVILGVKKALWKKLGEELKEKGWVK